MDFDGDSFDVACQVLQPPLALLADMGIDRRAICVCLLQAVGVISVNTSFIDNGEVIRELQRAIDEVLEDQQTRREADGTKD